MCLLLSRTTKTAPRTWRMRRPRISRLGRNRASSARCAEESSFQSSFIVRTYQNGIQNYPLLTKVTMAVFIFSTSDVVTQRMIPGYEEDDSITAPRKEHPSVRMEWDAARTLSAAIFGVASTTFLHYWWGLLEHSFSRMLPLSHAHLLPTLGKVLVHQSCAAPLYIYSYYVVTNFVQGVLHSLQQQEEKEATSDRSILQRLHTTVPECWNVVHAKAQEMFWPTMLRHWSVWPFVQTANFYCISLHHRILVHNSVLMLWSSYLSYLNHHHHHDRFQSSAEVHRNRFWLQDFYFGGGFGVWVRPTSRLGALDQRCDLEDEDDGSTPLDDLAVENDASAETPQPLPTTTTVIR